MVFGMFSHFSSGPWCPSPSPMAICGRFSRKKLVKCSPEIITMACTPVSRARSRTVSSAPKKFAAFSGGADSRSAVIIGACEAQ